MDAPETRVTTFDVSVDAFIILPAVGAVLALVIVSLALKRRRIVIDGRSVGWREQPVYFVVGVMIGLVVLALSVRGILACIDMKIR